MIKNEYRFSLKYPLFMSDLNETLIFSTVFFSENTQISNFMKIRPVWAELFHADRRKYVRTDMKNLVVAFNNFAKAPKIYKSTSKLEKLMSLWT